MYCDYSMFCLSSFHMEIGEAVFAFSKAQCNITLDTHYSWISLNTILVSLFWFEVLREVAQIIVLHICNWPHSWQSSLLGWRRSWWISWSATFSDSYLSTHKKIMSNICLEVFQSIISQIQLLAMSPIEKPCIDNTHI